MVGKLGALKFCSNDATNLLNTTSLETSIFSHAPNYLSLKNQTMKKQVQLQLIWAFLFGAMSFGANGQGPELNGEFEQTGITYKVTSTSPNPYEVKVVANTNTGDVVIPPVVVNVQNWKVTGIGDNAFKDGHLTSVIIPEGVTHIGIRAFADNRDMTSVVIPSTVTSIGHTAFWNCGLASLEIPEGITDIGDNTFGRHKLASVTIPASVTSIGFYAFITHPDSPSRMARLTMMGSTPPTLQDNTFTTRGEIHVIVPDGARDAYNQANDWTGFRSIGYGIFTDDDINYEITSSTEVTVLDYIGSTTAIEIPETVDDNDKTYTVTAIGADAFRENNLTEVTLSSTVTSIASGAFRDNRLTSVVIPDGVATIENGAFANNQLTSVVIPDGVTNIGAEAFVNNALESVTIPGSVTTIESDAFRDNQLTSVVIPDGVTSIGNSTFRNNHLTVVALSSTVTSIGGNAFKGNQGLALVTVEATDPPSLHENAFAFADRGQIDLIVPAGTREDYLNGGWTGFRSITEEGLVLTAGSNIEFKDFTVYPNPARDKVHIDPGPVQQLKQVNIYTMTGAYLYSESGPEINTGRLSRGMYLFEIVPQTGDRSIKRVIIQ